MKNFGRIFLFFLAFVMLVTGPVFAQDKAPSPLKLPSSLSPKSTIKALKRRKDRFKTVRTKALPKPAIDPKKKKKKTKKAKKKPRRPDGIKTPKPLGKPSLGKAKSALAKKDAKKDDKKVPGWRKVKEKEEEEKSPTLSADFIKNCAKLKPGVKVTLDIYDEELEAVVKLIACMTGKNIILAKPLKGKKITIYSPTMVTANEAYRAFLTALEKNGFTISRQGKFLRIIPIKEFARAPDRILEDGETIPNQDLMVTQIVPLKHVDASEMNEVLSKLATANAQFIVYQPSNSLIITEVASNLRKLRSLIRQLDIPGGQEELWVYQVLHAEANDIASKILEVFEKDKASKSRGKRRSSKRRKKRKAATSTSVGESELDVRVSKVISDERTNRLLIIATRRSYRKVKKLIGRLDIPVEGDGQVHIHQLNHAKANDLASVLSNLSSNQNRRSKRRRKSKKRRKKRGKSSSSSAALFEGEVSVTADEDTNSLVITASLKDYMALKRVIDVLDRPRRQVFIEAVLMEVSITNARKVGMSSHFGYDPTFSGEKGLALFGNQLPDSGGSIIDLGSASTLTGLAVQGPPIEVGGVSLPSFGAILRALATNSDINVLSTPHILTTDNEEAEIVVGDNVPFASGFVGGGGLGALGGAAASAGLGGLLPTVNVQRQDVALTLKITPRINAANFVTLEIDQVVEELGPSQPGLGPQTSKRKIKSTVVVKDQNTVVIGGLQKTKQLNKKSAVPFLGEIPLIGYFFRGSEENRERVNLLLMLTPHVIEGPQDFQAIMKRKLEEHKEFAERFHQKGEQLILSLDYRKKHGVLEAINQSIRQSREDQQLLEELKKQEKGPPLPQELDCIEDDETDERKCEQKASNASSEDEEP